MGLNIPCPYAEKRECGKCAPLCHAIRPVGEGLGRRLCGRTRQWPSCPRYIEAWKLGVTPYNKTDVALPEKTPMSRGIPLVEGALEGEPPCRFLFYREGSCASCGGYVCGAVGDKRIMDPMIPTCQNEPWSCEIHKTKVS